MRDWQKEQRATLQGILAKVAKNEPLYGGEITFLGWEAFDEWCKEKCTLDDEDFEDRVAFNDACIEAYSEACDNGWRPSWERPA